MIVDNITEFLVDLHADAGVGIKYKREDLESPIIHNHAIEYIKNDYLINMVHDSEGNIYRRSNHGVYKNMVLTNFKKMRLLLEYKNGIQLKLELV